MQPRKPTASKLNRMPKPEKWVCDVLIELDTQTRQSPVNRISQMKTEMFSQEKVKKNTIQVKCLEGILPY